jgi:hypothetical protein
MVYCFHVFFWLMLHLGSSRESGDAKKHMSDHNTLTIPKSLTFDFFDTKFNYSYY